MKQSLTSCLYSPSHWAAGAGGVARKALQVMHHDQKFYKQYLTFLFCTVTGAVNSSMLALVMPEGVRHVVRKSVKSVSRRACFVLHLHFNQPGEPIFIQPARMRAESARAVTVRQCRIVGWGKTFCRVGRVPSRKRP